MKLVLTCLALFGCSLIACNNAAPENEKPVVTDSLPASAVVETPTAVCYAGTHNRDTVRIQMLLNADSIKANIVYNWYEKDKNVGMAHLRKSGDTLLGTYSFISEGIVSEREIAFLQKGNSLVEGYAEMEDAAGKMIFKDRTKLKFEGLPLIEVECRLKQQAHINP